MSDVVLKDKQSGVGIIRLNRPKVFNAINGEMCEALISALYTMNEDPEVKTIFLTGEGKAFCSGQDLTDESALQSKDGHISLGETVRNRYNPLISLMGRIDKPIIAAVNGVAVGAGCSLALACDFRFVSIHTRFAESFVRIGLVPDSGSTYLLTRLVGVGRALEIALTGREVLGEEAVQIGLATKVVPADSLVADALAFATTLAQGPMRAINLTKRALYQGADCSLEEALELEAVYQEEVGRTSDFQEGIAAFKDKRQPVFTGQ